MKKTILITVLALLFCGISAPARAIGYCALADGAPVAASDVFAISKDCGGTRRVTAADIASYVFANEPSAGISISGLSFSSTDRIACRDSASGGAGEECTVGGGVEFTGSTGLQRSALTGDVTASAGSNTTAIASGVIVDSDVNASAGIDASKLGGGAVSNTEFGYLDGVTSAIQTQIDGKVTTEATLTALAAYNTNGLLTQTAADTFTGRTITGTSNRISVTNGNGVSGNPTLDIGSDVVTLTGTQTLTNKTLTDPTVNAGSGVVVLPAATSPAQTAEGSAVWDSDDDVLTIGNASSRATLVGTTASQTLTNKTLTSPVISSISNSGTITIPTGTLTLATLTGTETLTNKTLTNPTVNAGSGVVVLPAATSPAQTAEGSAVWDSDDDKLTVGTGASRKTLVASGDIVNADINASAAIALSKLATDPLARANHTGTQAPATITFAATDRILCRDTASGGTGEECTVGGGVEFTGSTGLQRSALTGDVTASAGSNTTAIASGVIVDGDVNASAGIDASKLGGGAVSNTEFGYLDGVTSAIQTQITGKATKTQTFFLSGFIEAPTNKTYTLVQKSPVAMTIVNTTTKSVSGTCTATFKIDGVALGGTANSVSSAEQTQAQASSNAVSVGNDVALTISSNSSCADVAFTVEYTRSLD